MNNKSSSKTRPAPLRDLQIALQADQSRRYLILDSRSSLPSPAYPFDPPLQQVHSPWQLLDSFPSTQAGPSLGTFNYSWNDSLDSRLDPAQHYRSSTPPISLPALSPRAQDAERPSKRSGGTFERVPAQANRRHVFTHVLVNPKDNSYKQDSCPPSVSPRQDGLPRDMQDMLRQLDDLANWVKTASSTDRNVASIAHATSLAEHPRTDAGGHGAESLCDGLFPNKGKDRLLLTNSPSGHDIHRDLVGFSSGAVPSILTKISPATDCRSGGFIYVPGCNTPEFLVGSSSSPIAYPVCGYSSHPVRYSPQPPDTTHDIHHPRRFLERPLTPCPPSTPPLVSPPSGKTSFKTLFQRSRCNITAVARSSIPTGHVPVENALHQGKRMRLPWLRI